MLRRGPPPLEYSATDRLTWSLSNVLQLEYITKKWAHHRHTDTLPQFVSSVNREQGNQLHFAKVNRKWNKRYKLRTPIWCDREYLTRSSVLCNSSENLETGLVRFNRFGIEKLIYNDKFSYPPTQTNTKMKLAIASLVLATTSSTRLPRSVDGNNDRRYKQLTQMMRYFNPDFDERKYWTYGCNCLILGKSDYQLDRALTRPTRWPTHVRSRPRSSSRCSRLSLQSIQRLLEMCPQRTRRSVHSWICPLSLWPQEWQRCLSRQCWLLRTITLWVWCHVCWTTRRRKRRLHREVPHVLGWGRRLLLLGPTRRPVLSTTRYTI